MSRNSTQGVGHPIACAHSNTTSRTGAHKYAQPVRVGGALTRVHENDESVWRITTCDTETSEHQVQTLR